LIEQFLKVKDSYNCDSLSLAGATAALADQEWMQTNRARVIASRQRLTQELTTLGFRVIESQANFVWCEHSRQESQWLYQQLKAERVLVRYMVYPGWREGLRISIGTDDQLDALLTLLRPLV
jgi:histidinol-phosphate aminotransferase